MLLGRPATFCDAWVVVELASTLGKQSLTTQDVLHKFFDQETTQQSTSEFPGEFCLTGWRGIILSPRHLLYAAEPIHYSGSLNLKAREKKEFFHVESPFEHPCLELCFAFSPS